MERSARDGRTLLVRYAFALAIIIVCLLLRLSLAPVLGNQALFITYYLGVVVAAYWLGSGPALLLAGAGALLTSWYFIPPLESFRVEDNGSALSLALYGLVSIAIVWAAHSQRKAEALAHQRYEELLVEMSARQAAERGEQRQRQWAHVTLASIADGVITTDAQGLVTFVNAVAEQLTGWSEQNAAGRPIHEIFRILNEDTRVPAEVPIARVLATGTVQGLANHTVLIARDGREVPIDDSAAPIRDGSGELLGAVLVFRDITERRRRESELRRSNEDLRKFAYVASHDLQQPLRMVASFVGLLRARYAGRLDEQADRYIQFAVDGAQRMQSLVQDLLEYSRAGTQKLKLRTVDLNQVIRNIELMLDEPLSASGAALAYGHLPAISGDEVKITQVFQNLITNAIKFRGEGPPHVEISAESRGNEWLFAVRDNGAGFDPGYSERIFLMFERLHSGDSNDGNGIGLAICKRVIEMHGGRIWAESKPGHGSAFYFTIPVEATAEQVRKAVAS